MSTKQKIFYSIFGTSAVLSFATSYVGYLIGSGQMVQENIAITPIVALLVVCCVASFVIFLLARLQSYRLMTRWERIFAAIEKLATSPDLSFRFSEKSNDEVSRFANYFDQMLAALDAQQTKVVSGERDRVLSNIASQVAHDVRSPLAALETVLANTKGIEEEKRVMIRTATKRIKDIANNLLEVYKSQSPAQRRRSTDKRPYHVGMLVESIVSEKRVRYGDSSKLQIESDVAQDALDLFLNVDQNDMKRVLSNLIDNAVESYRNRHGTVYVRLLHINGVSVLQVSDNGVGIHADKIKKIMEDTTSKSEGNRHGIGLAYVREKCSEWGAEFLLESTEAKGTSAKIKIRSVPPPTWFTSVINIRKGHQVVIVDDDPSIHQVWRTRLAGHIEPISVNSIEAFESKVKELRAADKDFFSLVDYEFIGDTRTGIDAIKHLGVASTSVLVTSRHDEEQVNERCTDLRIKMIPKGVAPVIPIKFISSDVKYVFLDDDPFIVEAWEIDAKSKHVDLATFSDIDKLLDAAKTLPPETFFYLDHNLGGELSGIDVAKKLHGLGFREIFLSTGYDPDHFKDEKVIKGVFGKEPPF